MITVPTFFLVAPSVAVVVWWVTRRAANWRIRRVNDEMAIIEALPHRVVEPWTYALDLHRQSNVRSDRFHAALERLERAGTIEARWDEGEPDYARRRRLYRLKYPT